MRIGICMEPERIGEAERFGFDYLEAALAPLALLGEEEFSQMERRLGEHEIRVECFNILFPGEISLLGPGADRERLAAYLHRAFGRARRLGGGTVVFGSGRSRACPPELPYREGCKQLREAAALIVETAARYGITVALEPLNTAETNMVNSLTEAALLAFPGLGLLADSYHMFRENEPFGHIVQVSPLSHVHVALLEGRRYPVVEDERLRGFFEALKASGYNGRVSIEGSTDAFETDAPAALAVLRGLAG